MQMLLFFRFYSIAVFTFYVALRVLPTASTGWFLYEMAVKNPNFLCVCVCVCSKRKCFGCESKKDSRILNSLGVVIAFSSNFIRKYFNLIIAFGFFLMGGKLPAEAKEEEKKTHDEVAPANERECVIKVHFLQIRRHFVELCIICET